MDSRAEGIFNRVQELYMGKGKKVEGRGVFGLKSEKHVQNLEEIGRDELFHVNMGEIRGNQHKIITRPCKNLTVLVIGNHSAGKSSFINWYVDKKVQSTGIAIETSHFTMIKYGEKELELKSEGTMALYPFLREIMNASEKEVYGKFFSNLTTKVCTKRSKNFEHIDFIDTPGLSDGNLKYGCDIIEMMKWVSNFVDLILVFLDPIGQALCTKTMDMIHYLSQFHSTKTRICLTKIDQVEPEDFAKLTLQVYSSIVMKTQEIHLDLIPISIIPEYNGGNNKLSVLLEHIEASFKGKSIRNVEIMTNDCRFILKHSEKILDFNQHLVSKGKLMRGLKYLFFFIFCYLAYLSAPSFSTDLLDSISKLDQNPAIAALACLLFSLAASKFETHSLTSSQLQKVRAWQSYCYSAIKEGEDMTQEYFNS